MLGDLRRAPETNPGRIFGLRESSFAGDLFITAVAYFDFFKHLDSSPADIDGVCRALGIKKRPADVMLTLFRAYGLVKRKNGRYHLTDTSKDFLTRNSPFDLSSYVSSLKARPVCEQMKKVMTTGQPAKWAAGLTGSAWAAAMNDAEFAEAFTAGMNSRGAYLAGGLAKAIDLSARRRLLDIGGGSGIYSAVLLDRFPELKATVFEKSPVDGVAGTSLKKLVPGNRADVYTGDMFKTGLPVGYDVHLLSHVLHDWDLDAVKLVLRNSYRSLAAGGTIIIHDAHINRKKNGPVSVAEYSVLLMFLSEGKCYSIAEMEDVLGEAGFSNITCRPTVLNRSVITARKPA